MTLRLLRSSGRHETLGRRLPLKHLLNYHWRDCGKGASGRSRSTGFGSFGALARGIPPRGSLTRSSPRDCACSISATRLSFRDEYSCRHFGHVSLNQSSSRRSSRPSDSAWSTLQKNLPSGAVDRFDFPTRGQGINFMMARRLPQLQEMVTLSSKRTSRSFFDFEGGFLLGSTTAH